MGPTILLANLVPPFHNLAHRKMLDFANTALMSQLAARRWRFLIVEGSGTGHLSIATLGASIGMDR